LWASEAARKPSTPASGYTGAIERAVNGVVLDHLMILAADQHASAEVRAIVLFKLDGLKNSLASREPLLKDAASRAEFLFARNQIDRFERNPADVHRALPAPPLAGDPIGEDGWD
jgi:hypothetical protein